MEIGLDTANLDLPSNDMLDFYAPVERHDHRITHLPTGNFANHPHRFSIDETDNAKVRAVQHRTFGIRDYETKVEVEITWNGKETKTEVKASGKIEDDRGNKAEVSYKQDTDGQGKFSASSSHSKESSDRPDPNGGKK